MAFDRLSPYLSPKTSADEGEESDLHSRISSDSFQLPTLPPPRRTISSETLHYRNMNANYPVSMQHYESFYGLIYNVHDAMLVIEAARIGKTKRIKNVFDIDVAQVRPGAVFVSLKKNTEIRGREQSRSCYLYHRLDECSHLWKINGSYLHEKRVTVTSAVDEEITLRSFHRNSDIGRLHQPIEWAKYLNIKVTTTYYPMYHLKVQGDLAEEAKIERKLIEKAQPYHPRPKTVLPPPLQRSYSYPDRNVNGYHSSRDSPSYVEARLDEKPVVHRPKLEERPSRLSSYPYSIYSRPSTNSFTATSVEDSYGHRRSPDRFQKSMVCDSLPSFKQNILLPPLREVLPTPPAEQRPLEYLYSGQP
ncbi:hypothetical protein BKA69DRAFT_1126371 [Paraphysoderma sedebokerense]|nr:hypothetical protein BKA69DRAFT_1126371 [Paraphysoderma sedebokerense]